MPNPWMDPAYAARWRATERPGNPYRPTQVGVLLALVAGARPHRVVDLGCGPGQVAHRLLERLPDVELVCLDGSATMLDRARETLRTHAARVEYVEAPMESAWEEAVGGGVDVVFAVQSVHHLEREAKQALFATVGRVLRPGGLFLLADRIAFDPRLFESYLTLWNRARLRADFAPLPHTYDLARYEKGLSLNGDVPDSLEDQLAWLGEVGFDPVECFWRYTNRAVFGGVRA